MAASTFSYAQAAKGMSTPVPSSKPTSGTATPAKEPISTAMNGSATAVPSWADDAEADSVAVQPTATANEAQPQTASNTTQPTQATEITSVSSPDLGASSVSTVTKDDDVSSLPNASSESTWDNKSQASTSVDKSVEPVEKTSEKVKKGKNAVVKPLQDAPLPAVNIWKQRAEELKTKVQKPSAPLANGSAHGTSAKKADTEGKGRGKGQDEERNSHGRKDGRDGESRKKAFDKDAKQAANVLPPPPNRDQESWPTPDTAIDENRKKAQDKGDKERKESTSTASHGKHEWVKVPYTPTVVFNTPLPNAANPRRGGRPGGRGGSQTGGRPTGQSEKDTSAATVANGEAKRERAEGSATNDNATAVNGQAPTSAPEKAAKVNGASESDADSKSTKATESTPAASQNGSYPRQHPNRSNKPRRGDFAAGERRRGDGAGSPTKDNTFDRASAGTQTDATADGERRASTYHDGPNGHHKQGRFGAYPNGRERVRGGARGGRGSYSNGHQFANGHMAPLQTSGSFPLGPRSPTTFNPENPSFFAAPQGKFRGNGHRSQSVTNDAYRFTPYQGGPQVPAVQPYNMYDYGMMAQPMSAVPYSPYVDQYALFGMLTSQVEYYFSVDNLLKDMYLRKHMDSQGFVSLEFIAAFNRIKILSTDIDLIKLVCQQSAMVEYRTGEDGKDRLRRRENWEQWVLTMADRHESAQNDGPKELHHPPMPHVNGFDQANPHQWPMSAVEPMYGNGVPYPMMNGYGHGAVQDVGYPAEGLPNGTAPTESKDSAVPNGEPVEASTKAVSFTLFCPLWYSASCSLDVF